ncbi:RNA-protein complex protein Nop10 [Methanomassiliicoccaceae archaeon COG_1]|nr:RNA-protein complex protein Nop10 [Methanomassiliicoccaceae archaeon COG_1]
MPARILRCTGCGRYTLLASCPACGARTARPAPARFSPEDRYGRYRRMAARGDRDGQHR